MDVFDDRLAGFWGAARSTVGGASAAEERARARPTRGFGDARAGVAPAADGGDELQRAEGRVEGGEGGVHGKGGRRCVVFEAREM